MLEKIVAALEAIARELKRYNDRRDLTAPVETPTTEKPAAEKPAPAAKAEKPAAAPKTAPKAAPAEDVEDAVTFLQMQEAAGKFMTIPGKDRTHLVAVLKAAGVPPVKEGDKLIYKVSNAKDNPVLIAKVYAALTAEISGAGEDDPTA